MSLWSIFVVSFWRTEWAGKRGPGFQRRTLWTRGALGQGCRGDLDPDSLTDFWVTPNWEPADLLEFYFLNTAAQGGFGRGVLRFSHLHTSPPLSTVSEVMWVAWTLPWGSVPTMEIDKHCRSARPPPSQPPSSSDHWFCDIPTLLGKDETFGHSFFFSK